MSINNVALPKVADFVVGARFSASPWRKQHRCSSNTQSHDMIPPKVYASAA